MRDDITNIAIDDYLLDLMPARSEIFRELMVCDDVNPLQIRNGREIVEHPIDHRFARNFQERLRFRQGERIKPRRVAGGKDQDIHIFRAIRREARPKDSRGEGDLVLFVRPLARARPAATVPASRRFAPNR